MDSHTPDIQAHHQLLLDQHLTDFLGEIEPEALALLREQLDWVEIAGGETLMEQGDPGDALYLSVSGRLRAYIKDEAGAPQPVREMGRGQVFGEMSLYTGEPRTATVVAIRDSVLVRLDKIHFDNLLASSHRLSMALTRQIIQRLQTQHIVNPMPLPVTITLVPVSEGVNPGDMAARLKTQLEQQGSVTLLDSSILEAHLAKSDPALHSDSRDRQRRITLFLDQVESDSDFVLLVADDTPSDWTRRCCRHSDEILLLADATQSPALHPIETECLSGGSLRTEAAEVLVLLHPADTRAPRNTRTWLERRPVTDHVHIRPDLERDMARLARIETRTAVGLVLAGGGARGFAHLGVFKALQEAGMEIDYVGGTSMGAVMAALVAADQPIDPTFDICRRSFQLNPTGDFNWLPMLSLIRGQRLAKIIAQAFKELLGHDADLEDFWKTYYCVATNYSRAEEHVMRHGPLAKALRASTAIPGALPPILHKGDLLCDGATLNNFPVDIMRKARGVGTVIGIDLSVTARRPLTFDEVPGTWALLRDRLRKRHKRKYKLPSLASYLMNVSILYSTSRRTQSEQLTDLYFNPPLKKVGLLDWRRFDQAVRQGYDHGKEVLARQAAGEKTTQ
ncbi:patatin-like phospholipase family protein [Saccharospirillum impatiens]|uniref:patatin-like phospholipase family protein n=1 Tax=Saccharospirillum impatiens TaxID=169438 RepID=UPI00040EA231|nr:patatin-like phospholipase family protein [Saccharospirillum impatiens]